jgi:hypothetical protein
VWKKDMKKKESAMIHMEYLQKSSATLRGRQSVRATFKLTKRSIDALSILACQLGIKQKTLFDQVVDDSESLRVIAQEFEDFGRARQRLAKTYVISRKTLENLERVADRYNTPRDALVEFSIERILPLIEQEKEKHEKRKVLLQKLQTFSREGVKMMNKAEADLGADDPVFIETLKMMRHVVCCQEAVEDFVEKGNRMEDF